MSFAFFIHPLTARYMDRGMPIAKLFPESFINFAIRYKRPFLLREFHIRQRKGMFIGVPLTSDQLLNLKKEFVTKRLLQACEVAEKNGAKIASLGAFTAIASDQGKTLVGKTDIALTTGRALTIGAVVEKVSRYLDKDKSLGVIGSKGAIGNACIKYFKDHSPISITRQNFDDIYDCDVLISTTNTTKEIIDESKLKKGAAIFDVSKPMTINEKVKRKDITVLKAGSIKLPEHIDFKMDFDLEKDTVYACMAEPMILSLEERYEDYSIGDNISLEKVGEILRLAKKHGFTVV